MHATTKKDIFLANAQGVSSIFKFKLFFVYACKLVVVVIVAVE